MLLLAHAKNVVIIDVKHKRATPTQNPGRRRRRRQLRCGASRGG